MGDRGNVRVGGVYLYTHWGGTDIPGDVQRALKTGWRWDDTSYLARIIFEEMVGDDRGTETGFGIDASEGVSNNPLVTVSCNEQRVSYASGESWSFQEYVAADLENIQFH